jgi:hypothetical protein
MAGIYDPTPEQRAAWDDWVASRPACVRRVAERFDPWSLYRLRTTGHRVTIYAFDEGEDGRVTLKVDVTSKFNRVAFERRVFGIDPDDLEPCELPAFGEDGP